MKILIVGASGLVGSHLFAEAQARRHDQNYPMAVSTDGMKDGGLKRLKDALDEGWHPDAVIHSAGFTHVEGCEADPTRCSDENYHQPIRLAGVCGELGIRFCYISSAYAVFPEINAYAYSKALAEIVLLGNPSTLIPRLMAVWGKDAKEKCFPFTVKRVADSGVTLRVPSDQFCQPTWAGDAASWIISLIEARESGIWNLASEHPMARDEWARQCVPMAKITPCLTADLNPTVRRPLDCRMDCSRIQTRFPLATRHPSKFLETIAP